MRYLSFDLPLEYVRGAGVARSWLDRTYSMEDGPPRLSPEAYADRVLPEYLALLDEHPREEEVQLFFEKHPAIVFGAMPWVDGYPRHSGLLISQPRLPGFNAKIPDFMIVSGDSLSWRPRLIEIESPAKRLFTAKGHTRSEFNQARDQLSAWRAWFDKDPNGQVFRAEYGISSERPLPAALHLECILVYGRRREWEGDPELAAKRSALLGHEGDTQASYDRLADRFPDLVHNLYGAITVKPAGNGRFRACCVPPTFAFSPSNAARLQWIDGLADAINAQPDLEQDRKRFLMRRLPYWTDWAASGARGIVGSADVE